MTDTVRSLDELLRHVEIADIVLYEVAGRRRDGFDPTDGPPTDSGETNMRLLQDSNTERIRIRCQLGVHSRDGIYSVDAAGIFKLLKPVQVSPDLVRTFAVQVGVPAVYPYLRAELQMAARRLGLKPPILQLFRPEGQGLLDGGTPAA
ncbi:hypothetical protein AB0H63_15995 [Micromonospora echinospora]|uniref:hypothetical protein n=1 Tax=Micromonospora echinospora TaxID=1877 RepID=UPI0033EAD35F